MYNDYKRELDLGLFRMGGRGFGIPPPEKGEL
jgi:hypothetical protein